MDKVEYTIVNTFFRKASRMLHLPNFQTTAGMKSLFSQRIPSLLPQFAYKTQFPSKKVMNFQ